MARKPDLNALPLHDLLSAPLIAAAEAQVQTSLGLVDLIREIGFEEKDDNTNAPHQQQKSRKPRSGVRMVEFHYTREGMDADGTPTAQETRLRIPLLAMLSLPNLEISELNISILVKAQSVGARKVKPAVKVSPDISKRYPFLQAHPSLDVAPASRKMVKGAPQTTRPYDMEITLKATNEELSDGMQRILTALTGIITEQAEGDE